MIKEKEERIDWVGGGVFVLNNSEGGQSSYLLCCNGGVCVVAVGR